MPHQFIINGGKDIGGEIEVRGAKNFALKALAAALLTKEEVVIRGLPKISDVSIMISLLEKMGSKVTRTGERDIAIKTKEIKAMELDRKHSRRVRASIVMMGPLLSRKGEVVVPHPGGDLIGKRPINFFIDAFRKMGAKVKKSDSQYRVTAKNGLKGALIFFPKVSVTGTETVILAAVLARGTTLIKNAAMEPEIVHLCNYLGQMGARISGAGTTTIEIQGVGELKGGIMEVMPDRIEAGTFVMMGVMNNADLTVKKCNPGHLEALWEQLERAGAKFEIGGNWVRTIPTKGRLRSVSVQTHEYPGFATDLQPIYTLLMTQASGICVVHEPIFEGRLFFTDLLSRMGASIIMCDPHRVTVKGPTNLIAKQIESPDIRAGIALILAAIKARGESVINNAEIIDRGYEKIEERLRKIGVDIKRRKLKISS